MSFGGSLVARGPVKAEATFVKRTNGLTDGINQFLLEREPISHFVNGLNVCAMNQSNGLDKPIYSIV